MNYKIAPKENCPTCHGSGEFGQPLEAWGITVTEYLICDCVLDQLPDGFDEKKDDIEIVKNDDLDEWDKYMEEWFKRRVLDNFDYD